MTIELTLALLNRNTLIYVSVVLNCMECLEHCHGDLVSHNDLATCLQIVVLVVKNFCLMYQFTSVHVSVYLSVARYIEYLEHYITSVQILFGSKPRLVQ